MAELQKGLPEGVKFKINYDRSGLIEEAISSVKGTLVEVFISVTIVILIFLFHWRSAIIILIQIPVSVAFLNFTSVICCPPLICLTSPLRQHLCQCQKGNIKHNFQDKLSKHF